MGLYYVIYDNEVSVKVTGSCIKMALEWTRCPRSIQSVNADQSYTPL